MSEFENIKSVEVISREALENAGLIIFHVKDDTLYELAIDLQERYSHMMKKMGISAEVIVSNCLNGIEVNKSGGAKLYGIWTGESWVSTRDGEPLSGVYGVMVARLENFKTSGINGHLAGSEVRAFPTEPDGE